MEINNSDNNVKWYTDNQELYNDPEYQKIMSVIHNLWNSGVIQRGNGHCYSMSDIICKLLKCSGIDCYLEECNLMILKKDPPEIHLVGYLNTSTKSPLEEIRTHVVCITKTKYPLLIDLSISNYIDNIPYICEELNCIGNTDLLNFESENSYFKYSKKIDTQLPDLHQQSILDRIHTDRKIFKSIDKITKILTVIIVITSLNFVRGGYDFYQKYINQNNNFGPNKIK
jgi:hypothetical protein